MAEHFAPHRLVASALAYIAPRLDPDDLDAELALASSDLLYLAALISLASGIDIPERDVGGLRTVRQIEEYLAHHRR
jgi:acyl carrier protein